MKLSENVVIHSFEKEHYLIPVGVHPQTGKPYGNMMVLNNTSRAILALLAEETTQEQVIQGMLAQYNASRERIARDVEGLLDQLRLLGVLEE